MECKCPSCSSVLIKKNGHIHNGKQNYRCLKCSRQFVLEPTQKIIDEKTKDLIRRVLLERISLEGVCRAFEVSMPWLLEFIDGLIAQLPENLNAEVVAEDDEIEVVVLEADELWSYVGSKENPQWLWLVMHSKTRQIVAMQVGGRNKQTAEKLFFKLPEPLKKKPNTILTTSLCTMKRSPIGNTALLEKNLVRLLTLKDLTARLDSDAQDL
jgi:DNA-directed RNA polymerase subunit RPC12/RpoP